MTKSKSKYDDDVEPTPTSGSATPQEIQPGCSAPEQVPPSVVGTSHDPKRPTAPTKPTEY